MYIRIAFLFFLSTSLFGQTVDHSGWDRILAQYVDQKGMVNYKGLHNAEAGLDRYLDDMSTVTVPDLSDEEQMAYWINLYNAATVKLILENLPVKSITDLDNGKVWDREFVKTKRNVLSLNNIEHDILRKKFQDPRIHAAVNCASISCPPLLNRAYTGATLDHDLTTVTKNWINNPKYNLINQKSVQISRIFDWYKADFGNVIDFVNQYSDVAVEKTAKVSYLNYDWNLNKQ